MWPHRGKGSTWLYVSYCESVQSAGFLYGTDCTLSQWITYTEVNPFAMWVHIIYCRTCIFRAHLFFAIFAIWTPFAKNAWSRNFQCWYFTALGHYFVCFLNIFWLLSWLLFAHSRKIHARKNVDWPFANNRWAQNIHVLQYGEMFPLNENVDSFEKEMRLNKSKCYRNFSYLKTVMPIFLGLYPMLTTRSTTSICLGLR